MQVNYFNLKITENLFNTEIIGSLVWIFGSFILISAAEESKKILFLTQRDQDIWPHRGPDITTFIARSVLTLGNIIAATASTARTLQRSKKIMTNQPITGSLFPNVTITIGLWISVIGTLIASMGDYKRASENASSLPIE